MRSSRTECPCAYKLAQRQSGAAQPRPAPCATQPTIATFACAASAVLLHRKRRQHRHADRAPRKTDAHRPPALEPHCKTAPSGAALQLPSTRRRQLVRGWTLRPVTFEMIGMLRGPVAIPCNYLATTRPNGSASPPCAASETRSTRTRRRETTLRLEAAATPLSIASRSPDTSVDCGPLTAAIVDAARVLRKQRHALRFAGPQPPPSLPGPAALHQRRPRSATNLLASASDITPATYAARSPL